MSLLDRIKHSWNAFFDTKEQDKLPLTQPQTSLFYRPDRIRLTAGNDRSIITSIYTRLAIDCASMNFRHVRLDEKGRYIEDIESGLNNCLSLEANKDQISSALIRDFALTLFDEGCAVIVPVDTTGDPFESSYDILSVRIGTVVQWYPDIVRIRLYNDRTGKKEDITLPKKMVGIVENPFYTIMNEPNSTAKRLMRKLSLLDISDEKSASNRLDMIVQLPYSTRTELKRAQAADRRKEIEDQLVGSPYGIAYIDSTERITQLNRSVDNQLLSQIEALTRTLYSQLGLTEEIMNGTADEKTMNNYYARTIEPITSAFVDELRRKFLTKTARTQKQTIMCFRDPFKLIPATEIAEMADKFTRNEIMTSNEIRQVMGLTPSEDPKANELRNANISAAKDEIRRDVDGNEIDVGVKDTPQEVLSNG